jgi:NAD(P)-dependent dehydrogenase (short-subunit alcohol dehydrogenase family)
MAGRGSRYGQVVVVTGAASGIGLALAKRFALEGARLVLADRNADAVAEVARTLEADGTEAHAVPTDVGDPRAVDALAAAAMDRFGIVHVVCNNAGIVLGGLAWEVPLDDWHRLMQVNLWGVVHGIHTFVPLLLAHDEPGYVVNTASMAGVTAIGTLGPYVASKHAVVGLSEVLVHDLAAVGAGERIGVSVVCPGYIPTRIGLDDPSARIPEVAPGGVSADDAAATVAAAMDERRLYVFTHDGSIERFEARVALITATSMEPRTP